MFKKLSLRVILITAIVLLVIIYLTTTINNLNQSKEYRDKPKDNELKIGFSMDSLVVERWQRDRDIFVAKAKELGATVIVQRANNDTEEQIRQVNYLIDEEQVDVLVIVPHDGDAFTNVVAQAKKKGIKVIAYDRLIRNADIDLYVSFNNKEVGILMAKDIVEKVPKGNYVIINGGKEDYNTYYLNEGLFEVLTTYTEKQDINILKEVWATGWKEEIAYNTIDEIVNTGQTIDGIICGNDILAEAAIKALAERRLAGKVYVVGQDATLGGCQRIIEGTQNLTIYKPIKNLAQKAAEYSVMLIKDEKIITNEVIDNGKRLVPFHMEEPIAVNKDNILDTVVKDSFHSEEAIYKKAKATE